MAQLVKESACNEGDLRLIPGLGRSPGEGKGYPVQCPGLENPMECIVHGVAKSQTELSEFHFTYQCLTYVICCLFTLSLSEFPHNNVYSKRAKIFDSSSTVVS